MNADLQTLRGRIFFWIGLGVLPVFWLWWMTGSRFSKRQIRAARIWTSVYVAALLAAWWAFPDLQTRVIDLQWTYAHVSFQVGFVLWLWFAFRTTSISRNIFGFIIGIDIIAMMEPLVNGAIRNMLPHPISVVFVLIPAAAHLLVEPFRRFRQRVIADHEG